MSKSLAVFAIAFVLGVWIHQNYLSGRPLVPIIVGTLIVAQIFNWIFGIDTPPIQVFHVVQRKTSEELA
jgi:hypothetical protein